MAPRLLPIQSRWDAPLVTALTAVSFWVFSRSALFSWGDRLVVHVLLLPTAFSWSFICVVGETRGARAVLVRGVFGISVGRGGAGASEPRTTWVVVLSPSRRGGCRCVVFCGNARLEVASPPRVRPSIVYTIYTIHLPTFPIREMTTP